MHDRIDPGPALGPLLRRLHLRVESPDEETLSVRRVLVDAHCFNKRRTNLLIKRPAGSLTCCVCVDADLEYIGTNPEYAQAFASGLTKMGWRILSFGGMLAGAPEEALQYAFAMLGAGDDSPGSAAPDETKARRLLLACTEDLSEQMRNSRSHLTLFRDEEIEQVAGCILGWHGRLALVLGEAGVGKSNLLRGVAQVLPVGRTLRAANMGAFMAGAAFESERESRLRMLLAEARAAGVALALEEADRAIVGVPLAHVILRESLDQGLRLIATSEPRHAAKFAAEPLGSRTESVRLHETCPSDTQRVLELLRPQLSAHHGVRIDEAVEEAAVNHARSLDGQFPGKAVGLLDAAAAHARLNHCESVLMIDVLIAAAHMAGE